MPKETPEQRGDRILREQREVHQKAIEFFLPVTIGEAVIALAQAGEELSRDSLLARLRRDAEFGSKSDQNKALAAIAVIETLPRASAAPP